LRPGLTPDGAFVAGGTGLAEGIFVVPLVAGKWLLAEEGVVPEEWLRPENPEPVELLRPCGLELGFQLEREEVECDLPLLEDRELDDRPDE